MKYFLGNIQVPVIVRSDVGNLNSRESYIDSELIAYALSPTVADKQTTQKQPRPQAMFTDNHKRFVNGIQGSYSL